MNYILIYFTIGFTITFLVEFLTQAKEFVEDEKSKYPELAKISDVYISTMVRVLFHMIREVKILSDKNELQSVLPSYTLLSLIEQGKNDAHLFFPMR